MEKKHLIVLSGNMAVGKSTIGPLLSKQISAVWLPETELSMKFPYLIADSSGDSKLISEITFASLRTAMILSKFLEGINRIVVERSLWDDWIFYLLWRDRFTLSGHDNFMKNLFALLESHHLKFQNHTILLNSQLDLLSNRIQRRNKPYDHIFTDEVINDFQRYLDNAVEQSHENIIKTIDVSYLDIENEEQVAVIIQEMVNAVNSKINQ